MPLVPAQQGAEHVRGHQMSKVIQRKRAVIWSTVFTLTIVRSARSSRWRRFQRPLHLQISYTLCTLVLRVHARRGSSLCSSRLKDFLSAEIKSCRCFVFYKKKKEARLRLSPWNQVDSPGVERLRGVRRPPSRLMPLKDTARWGPSPVRRLSQASNVVNET